MARGTGKGQLEKYTQVIMNNGSDALWQFYRNVLQGPMSLVLPEHTRDALFQLFCDLRTNVSKDQKWAYQHGLALKPRTSPGWIALGAFLFAVSALSALGSSALIVAGLGIAAAFSGLIFLIGAIAGFWMLVLSGCLFASTFLFAWLATCSAAGYAILTVIRNALQLSERAWQRVTKSQGASQVSTAPKASDSTVTEEVNSAIRKGKRTFTQLQDELKTASEELNEDIKDLSRQQNQSAPSSSQDSSQTFQQKDRQQSFTSPAIQEKSIKPDLVDPPDLSPGRILTGPNESYPDAKGPLDLDFKPEGGPSVPGKFAEAVHPDAISSLHQNGHG